ncbi:MAG: hypothetical protein D6696_04195 [Acidobacteria bacterium]|nr:MAG: hypothetical protein D6696_04195 [Acidobacteriota bacterium]
MRHAILIPALLSILAAALTLSAQESGEDVEIILRDLNQRPQLRLAFPAASYHPGLNGVYLEAARELEETLRADLDLSGVFLVQGPAELAVLQLTGKRAHDFEQFRSLGNQVVLYAELKQESSRIVLEGRVYDLASGQSVLGKRYRGEVDQARQIAHRFADEVVAQFTGRPGIAQTLIAFHSDRDGFQEVYIMDYDGRNQRRVTGHRSTSGFPEWSPSGDVVAYVTYFTASPTIFFADMKTGRKTEVYGQGSLNLSPSFSPDGTMIAFAHADGTNTDIYVCPRICTQPQRLTRARGIDTNPAWSPQGDRIAFTSDRSGQPQIYVMDRDGSNVRRISFEGDFNDGATWRYDGAYLAYASRRGNKFQIVVTDVISLASATLTHGPDSYEEPSYSPDGRRLVLTRKRGRDSQIVVMNADGSGMVQLTHEGRNFAPDWSSWPR